jgi:hypothetical protein
MITLDQLTQSILENDVEKAQQTLVEFLNVGNVPAAMDVVEWIASFAALVELLDQLRPVYEGQFDALQQKHLDGLRANYASVGLP